MAPFLGKRKTEARVPWTFILLVHFQHNRTVSFFFVLLAVIPIWLGSPHLLYSYAGVSFSLSLKAVVSNKPSLVFFLSCSVILSFLFHNPLSEFLLSIWATWSSPFLEWRQKKVFVVGVVQSLNPSWLFATPWTAARQGPLSFTISEFAQIHVHWVRDAI